MLKLLVSAADRTLLGVHVFGTGATELVHIGQMLMTTGGTVDILVDTVFNYPTLAESYKVAALDAINRVRAASASLPDALGCRGGAEQRGRWLPVWCRAVPDRRPGAGRDRVPLQHLPPISRRPGSVRGLPARATRDRR